MKPKTVEELLGSIESLLKTAVKLLRSLVPGGSEKLGYSIPNFAKAVDLSVSSIYEAIDAGQLIPSYPNRKPLITRAEAERWLASLSPERP